ncbi:MAG: anti-sigma factor antagonist [Lachnospiraceae bacterium]|nr:anti-sigma factor antagonist [Lachnospiraceae bacterium]
MNEVRGETRDGKITIFLSGRVDSANAREVELAVREILDQDPGKSVVVDAEALEYLSSAGLRVILRLRQQHADLRIIGVNSEVYEIFEMTGFTEMMSIEKAYRTVSVEGAEEIGRGANGTIYRIDEDNVVKVYNNADALEEILHEREVARKALVLGIPTAISYDVVKVGDSYGSVFELLNARSFSKILAEEPEKMDWCVEEYVKLLEKIHGTLVPKGDLPDIRETVIGWAQFMQDYLPPEAGKKLLALVRAVPHDDHMIHGDYHTKNVELTGDEVLLIDMDTLAVGHPIFELASMYNAFVGYSEYDHDMILQFQGFDRETSVTFWNKVLARYLHTDEEEKIRAVEDKARIIGYTRMIRRSIRRKGLENEAGRAEIELWKKELLELLDRTDSLLFNRNELTLPATKENLAKVTDFIEALLDEAGCPLKTKMQISIAVEEIYVNIANYAYAPGTGDVTVTFETAGNPRTATMRFIDSGIPYDPLAKKDPDVTRSAEEREIGGLGVFIVKKTMDDIYYEYKDGRNILTMKKKLL